MAKVTKLWAFGDSFTYCFELQKQHEYYKFKTQDGKPYIEWLADYYDAELYNYGTPGWGNIHILHDLLAHAPSFSDNDIIIVGTSDSCRVQSFEYNSGKETFAQASYSSYIDDFVRNNATTHINKDFPNSLVNYLVNCKLPLVNQHNWYDISMIINVLKICKGGKKAIWDVHQWGNYETINKHTKGLIPDIHWSWNGHKEFFLYLKDNLDKTDFFLDNYILKFYSNYNYLPDPLFYERIIPKLTV